MARRLLIEADPFETSTDEHVDQQGPIEVDGAGGEVWFGSTIRLADFMHHVLPSGSSRRNAGEPALMPNWVSRLTPITL
jgi:hypothetical protein